MKKIISSTKAPKAIGPYSQAVESNNMLFISGQVPINPGTGKIVEGGIKEQTSQVLENIKAILYEAGYSIDQVVKTTCFMSNLENFKEMNEVYAQLFKDNPPARATIEVSGLPLGSLIEIEVFAVKSA
ncbi:MAG: RidA family protein [Bacteroidales bacterium]|nr:RidA family protein [Bacteroidales bacterium]